MLQLVAASGPLPDRLRRRAALAAAHAVFRAHGFSPAACAAAAVEAQRCLWHDRRRASCWYAAELAALGAYWPDFIDRDPAARLAWLSLRK